jgi:hypothetical protein
MLAVGASGSFAAPFVLVQSPPLPRRFERRNSAGASKRFLFARKRLKSLKTPENGFPKASPHPDPGGADGPRADRRHGLNGAPARAGAGP